MANRTTLTEEKKDKFITFLSANPNVAAAAKKIRVSRDTLYRHKKEDEAFAQAWDSAIEEGTDALEDEAVRRALEGTKKPVYQGGKLAGHVQEYSDTLLIFLLKGRRPEKYRDKVEVGGAGGEPITFRVVYGDKRSGTDDSSS